jgi:VanZ family protein
VRSVAGFGWFSYSWLERIANVVLFVPLAAVLVRIVGSGRWLVALAGCVALSVVVEAAQWAFLPERTASVADVLANAAGALVGIGVGPLARSRPAETQPGASPSLEHDKS